MEAGVPPIRLTGMVDIGCGPHPDGFTCGYGLVVAEGRNLVGSTYPVVYNYEYLHIITLCIVICRVLFARDRKTGVA